MIEYMHWYQPGAQLVRCAGDNGCGALMASGDTDVHTEFHLRTDPAFGKAPSPGLTGKVCTDPDCTIRRKPGFPMHGPHDFRAKGVPDAVDLSGSAG